jgi:hypothetical protein
MTEANPCRPDPHCVVKKLFKTLPAPVATGSAERGVDYGACVVRDKFFAARSAR